MSDNPDVSRFVVRVDSFGPNGEPGPAPNDNDIEDGLRKVLMKHPRLIDAGLIDVHVEVEERQA